jgi:uncharacterized hydrophobic protein (TIGR00271 family)
VLQLRVTVPAPLSEQVVALFRDDPAVSALILHPGAALAPAGDLVTADVPREAVNDLVDRLVEIGVPREGTIHVQPVPTWVSQRGLAAERLIPGASADAVVWADVTQRAYDETELNWTYLSFMTMATVLASIAIVLDSQILVIGAMVLGPEFVAVAALGLSLVRRRRTLLASAARTLLVGFAVAIAVTTLLSLVGRAAGWIDVADLTTERDGTAFIYTPDRWSFLVALLAGAAGTLSLTSAKVGGLSGVFISVTTVPAAGNVALGLAFGLWDEVGGSTLQLVVNIAGMALAGWAALALQQRVWHRLSLRRPGRASTLE